MDLPGRSALRTGTRFLDAASNVVKKGADIVKKGATAKGIAATKLGAAAGGGMGLGTGLAVAGGAVAAGAAARAAWNIWHSKMKPQVDSLGATLDELQARTTKLQSKAFTQAMAGFHQRFDTAMEGAAFRDSDRVILGQAMALIDFYNNLAQTMFKVQKMQAARDISGTGGKIGVAGGNVKIMEEPGLKEEYSLQELFGFGKKKEQEFQSDDTPDDDTTTGDSKTDSKKDNAKNWESKVNSVFSTLRAGTLSGAPSKFTGAIKNMWATIGFKPAKTNLPPEFNEQAIDSLIAGFLNTILAPGSGGAQGALKLSEMATGIDECLGKTLMEMSARYDLAVLTEDLQAFMLRTPDLSAIADETAQAATPPPPADSQQIKKVVAQTSPEGNKGVDSAGVPGAAPKSAPGVAPTAAKKAASPEAVAPAPNVSPDIKLKGKPALMGTYAFGKSLKQIQQAREKNPKLKIGGPEHRAMWEKELQRIFKTKTLAEAARILRLMILTEAKPVKMGFGAANSGGNIYTGPGGAIMRGAQSGFSGNEMLDKAFLDKLWNTSFGYWDTNRNRTADELMQFARDSYSSKGENVGTGAADTIGLQARPEASTASDYTSDPVEAEKQKEKQNQAKTAALKARAIVPATKARIDAIKARRAKAEAEEAFAAAAGVTEAGKLPMGFTGSEFKNVDQYGQRPLVAESVRTTDGYLVFPRFDIALSKEQEEQAKSTGLLQIFVKMLNAKSLLEEKIDSLINSKNVLKEGVELKQSADKLDVLNAYNRELKKSLNQVANRIRMINIQYNFR